MMTAKVTDEIKLLLSPPIGGGGGILLSLCIIYISVGSVYSMFVRDRLNNIIIIVILIILKV